MFEITNQNKITFIAVGDIGAFYQNSEKMFEQVETIFKKADLCFGNNERLYSSNIDENFRMDRFPYFPQHVSPEHASALTIFDIMSFASNHSLDLGPEIMLDTIKVLNNQGIKVIGAGKNIDEARKPAIFKNNSIKIGFLSYCSVVPIGSEATKNKPGIVPLRASTWYEAYDWQPGTPPIIRSKTNESDLDNLINDIKLLKKQVNFLVISMHWGIHFQRSSIAEYQKEIAHTAIDHGADIIIGHHPHVIKGIELYKGKPIFYSLGNFAFDFPSNRMEMYLKNSKYLKLLRFYQLNPDLKWEKYARDPIERNSMIAKFTLNNKTIEEISLLPVTINKQAQPETVKGNTAKFKSYLEELKLISTFEELNVLYRTKGDEIIVLAK